MRTFASALPHGRYTGFLLYAALVLAVGLVAIIDLQYGFKPSETSTVPASLIARDGKGSLAGFDDPYTDHLVP